MKTPHGRRDSDHLQQQVDRQRRRLQKAEKERHSLLAETVLVGSLGLSFIAPVVGGAYLGRWIDGMQEGYSIRWTLSLLFVGILLGGYNVYRNIRE